MDSIMQFVSEHKSETSLMFMCTPTDVYAVPKEVAEAAQEKFKSRRKMQKLAVKGVSALSLNRFFQAPYQDLVTCENGKTYGIADCLVVEQGPNYALAKRIQQWRATLARHQGQRVSINIAPSTTTHSVTKNPLLKAAFNGAELFDVEAFSPETTNAIMAALWIHDLRNESSVANPETVLDHPLELMMEGANHGGLWRVLDTCQRIDARRPDRLSDSGRPRSGAAGQRHVLGDALPTSRHLIGNARWSDETPSRPRVRPQLRGA
jgi:hypothetical protein